MADAFECIAVTILIDIIFVVVEILQRTWWKTSSWLEVYQFISVLINQDNIINIKLLYSGYAVVYLTWLEDAFLQYNLIIFIYFVGLTYITYFFFDSITTLSLIYTQIVFWKILLVSLHLHRP